MATSGTNNTVKWELTNNILTISPLSGDSGIANGLEYIKKSLDVFISLTDEEWDLVQSIVFTGDVSFHYWQTLMPSPIYSPVKDYHSFFPFDKMPNITSIDVSGLNTSGATNMGAMFSHSVEPQITSIIGLDSLDTSECEDFNAMFIDLPLSSVDISSFNISQTADISAMFNRMRYCQRITLPQNFSRKDTGMDNERYKYSLGITSSGTIPITKDGVTITNDEDFFKLTSSQGGTWERDLSGVATLSFKVTSSVREGNEATLSYNYLTTSATARVYLKKSTDSSFPSSPVQTINLNGTGSSSTVLQLATDDAYDVMIIVDDGETTLYTYPSIDSNILLLQIDEEGNVEASGDVTAGKNLQGEDCKLKLDTSATSGVDKEIYDALVALNWDDCITND